MHEQFPPQINLLISFSFQAFPSLKPRRRGRRGQVRYHYMRLQFVDLSTRPPKSMWEKNNSDVSDSDGSTRKRKRGVGTKKTTSPSSKRGKVSTVGGGSAPISTPQATTNVTAEETFEEDTAIVRCEYPSHQPHLPTVLLVVALRRKMKETRASTTSCAKLWLPWVRDRGHLFFSNCDFHRPTLVSG